MPLEQVNTPASIPPGVTKPIPFWKRRIVWVPLAVIILLGGAYFFLNSHPFPAISGVSNVIDDVHAQATLYGVPHFKDIPIDTGVVSLINPYSSVTDFSYTGYIRQDDSIYFYVGSTTKRLVSSADANTFKQYKDTIYAKDKNRVYTEDKILGAADPITFEAFKGYFYAKDKNHVYWNASVLNGAATSTFEVMDTYAKDRETVFLGSRVIDADPQTFQLRSDGLTVDKSALYCEHISRNDTRLEQADLPTLTSIVHNELVWLAKDKNVIWDLNRCETLSLTDIENSVFVSADPATFIVTGNFGKDKDHVFFFGDPAARFRIAPMPLLNADPVTFRQGMRSVSGNQIVIGAEDGKYIVNLIFDNNDSRYQWDLRSNPK